MEQAGYLYVYLSNEGRTTDGGNVYFDALRVNHKKGAVIQEDHYYPFGLTINALSSSAPLSKPNKFKYNGKELNTEFGLDWSDYGARNYDGQLGRFFNQDRFAEKYMDMNPYQYGANDPIKHVDINGDSIHTVFKNGDKEFTEMPVSVQIMFEEEFGISVGYNAKTKMLYMKGKAKSGLSQSKTATEQLIAALTDTNSSKTGKGKMKHGKLVFGTKLRAFDGTTVESGYNNNKESYIALDGFTKFGESLNHGLNGVKSRALNMARVFEHEYLGHNRTKGGASDPANGSYRTGQAVDITNVFRRERGLQERLNYGGKQFPLIVFGSTSDFGSKKEQQAYLKGLAKSGRTPKTYAVVK